MRSTLRTPTVAVLFGVHWRLPTCVEIAFQFGASVLNQQWGREQHPLVSGTVVESQQDNWSHWYLRPSVGGESGSERCALPDEQAVRVIVVEDASSFSLSSLGVVALGSGPRSSLGGPPCIVR
jgi:hypothetical protein